LFADGGTGEIHSAATINGLSMPLFMLFATLYT